jgi:purine-binding chemotaxis protein CheW
MNVGDLSLLCRVGTRWCALPLASVVETMRSLPLEPISGAPDFVLGLSIVRGFAVPIVDAGRLLGARSANHARIVILKVPDRRVGLAVEAVLGVRAVASMGLGDLPPLIRTADADALTAVGALDNELLLALSAARIVPDEVLQQMETEALAS